MEFAKLIGMKKIILMFNLFDLILLLFMDYILAINLGINVNAMFLTSIGGFIMNVFTPQFFEIILGLIAISVFYFLAFPFVFYFLLYRLMQFVYVIINGFIAFPIEYLYRRVFLKEKIHYDDSLLSWLEWNKYIKVVKGGNRLILFLRC